MPDSFGPLLWISYIALSILVNLVVQTLWDPCVNLVVYIAISL